MANCFSEALSSLHMATSSFNNNLAYPLFDVPGTFPIMAGHAHRCQQELLPPHQNVPPRPSSAENCVANKGNPPKDLTFFWPWFEPKVRMQRAQMQGIQNRMHLQAYAEFFAEQQRKGAYAEQQRKVLCALCVSVSVLAPGGFVHTNKKYCGSHLRRPRERMAMCGSVKCCATDAVW
ncbi:hypothetical protein BaRGS_00001771 [Batillaria attramentaria]|uniref:Uncharacterized protein n=1 Tax=Batillaria attramentaria TaxID=370345 RepID=A0ABD0M5E1_9CAEN